MHSLCIDRPRRRSGIAPHLLSWRFTAETIYDMIMRHHDLDGAGSLRPRTDSPGKEERSPRGMLPALPVISSPAGGIHLFPLARGAQFQPTIIAAWACAIIQQCGLATDAIGAGIQLEGGALAQLQRRTNDAFIPPVWRITLHEPLLAFRFYGDLCVQVTQLYTSLATVRQVPAFGRVTKELLGLTGRNSADHLVAMRIEPGSQIIVGGISNRAAWADQLLVEVSTGLTVVDATTAIQLTH